MGDSGGEEEVGGTQVEWYLDSESTQIFIFIIIRVNISVRVRGPALCTESAPNLMSAITSVMSLSPRVQVRVGWSDSEEPLFDVSVGPTWVTTCGG